jgi:spore coat polysaccharide biosynthesis predicted glycosyltransferase SpsG
LPQNQINNLRIAIIASFGKELGNGHIQRMTSLLWFLNTRKNTTAFLISDKIPDFLPADLRKYIKSNIDFLPDLIIRDMRDSSEEEINLLKKSAKVIVVDDMGPGRRTADLAIDILPNPDKAETEEISNDGSTFIYGYNFLSAVIDLKGKQIKKDLDFALYPGNNPDPEYINYLTSLLPDNSAYTVLNGRESYLIREGKKTDTKEKAYAETILSSKVIISHFGITLYEGAISGCRLVSINPTQYHSMLSEKAKKFLPLANLGEFSNINKVRARTLIRETIDGHSCDYINAQDVYNKIISGLEYFYKLIRRIV